MTTVTTTAVIHRVAAVNPGWATVRPLFTVGYLLTAVGRGVNLRPPV